MARKKKTGRIRVISIAVLIIIGIVSYFYSQGIISFDDVGSGVSEADTFVDFIDCGQGDSTLICSGNSVALIDTSTKDEEDAVINHLKSRKIHSIDHLILTHSHEDHIGGAVKVIEEFDVKKIYMSEPPEGKEPTTRVYRNLLEIILEKEIDLSFVRPQDRFTCGMFEFEILGPIDSYEDPNDQSIVLRGEYDKVSILFKGDQETVAEQELVERYGSRLKSTIYAVGHHGSRTASCDALLNAVRPRYAVVSCGEGNSYGHPHKEALDRLKTVDATVYRTDKDGTVTFLIDGKAVEYKETK